jgi:tetratricopeptide (TPR) repeat protein
MTFRRNFTREVIYYRPLKANSAGQGTEPVSREYRLMAAEKGGRRDMIGNRFNPGAGLAIVAALLAAALPPGAARAAGAIAVGQTDDLARDGYAFGVDYNDLRDSAAADLAVASCRATQARARDKCAVVKTFHDECFAFAMDSKLAPRGAEWALALTREAAKAQALSQCRASAGRECFLSLNGCDGQANFFATPTDAAGFRDRGLAYVDALDPNAAIGDFTQAIKLSPQNPGAYVDRGTVYQLMDEPDRALADFNAALAADPKHAEGYTHRGGVYMTKKQYDLAIADYNQAIALQPQITTPYVDLGIVHKAQGDLDAAIADASSALRADPNSEDAYTLRGVIYAKKGNYDAAVADYNAALALSPKDPGALYARGMAKLRLGDLSGGQADIAAALAIRPEAAEEYTKATQ